MSAHTISGDSWLVYLRRVSRPVFRIIFFPHAGAGPSAFRLLAEQLPREAEILCVQLPGRERRLKEPPLSSADEVITPLTEKIQSVCSDDVPTIMFGHSLGSLLSYCVVHRMGPTRMTSKLRALVLSGCQPPHIVRDESKGLHWRLSDEDLISEIRKLNGTDQEVLGNNELLELLLPTLRSDIRLADDLRQSLVPSISTPIIAIGGDNDPEVPRDEILAWRDYTKGSFEQRIFSGDHFFIDLQRGAVCEMICRLIL